MSPVGRSGLALPSGRIATVPVTLMQNSLRSAWEACGGLAAVKNHLRDAGGVPQIDEDHPAVIAAVGDPPGEGDGRAVVGGTQGAGGSIAEHKDSSGSVGSGTGG